MTDVKNPTEPDRRNSIGALRLLLAAMVVYTHTYYLGGFGDEWLVRWSHGGLTAGHVAVQCFFVLSGWLVATSWCRQPTLGRFLWHRFLRITPALWACLTITAFVFTPLLWLGRDGTPFFSLEPSAWGYVWRNLILPRTQIAVGPFPHSGIWPGDWNGSLWTLFYEGACYLMIAVLGIVGLLTRWRALGTALIIALLGLHIASAALPPEGANAYLHRLYDTPGKLLTLHFLAGALWAVWPQQAERLRVPPWFAGILLLGMALSWRYPVHGWLSPLVLPVILLSLAHHPLLGDFERRVGGDYSYGVYLYGYPVQQLLATWQVPQHGLPAYLLSTFALALGCAVASWHWIEMPALALKHAFWSRLRAVSPA